MIDDFKPRPSGDKSVAIRPRTSFANTATPKRETFQPPEAVAAADDLQQPALVPAHHGNAGGAPSSEQPPSNRNWRQKLALHWPPGKKEFVVAGVIVLLCALSLFAFLTHRSQKPVATVRPVQVAPKPVAPKPTTVPSTLSGLPVDPSVNQQPVTGIMVENSVQARPQAGLGQAGVVFEAIAEGGITRFLALYQDTAPDNVGPIRSARPYYLQWALGFDAGYAHVGGSPEALASIKAWGVRDLDQFYNAGAYHRTANRAAPHNVYTGVGTLNQLETAKGYATSNFTGFTRKKESPSKQLTAKSINLNISGPVYNAHYDYNVATNSYQRSEGGAAHVDANSNTQISPKVAIALVMPYSLAADGYHSQYNTIGTGQAYIFQDGTVTVGQWSKPSATTQFSFTDSTGKTIALNPGQTWLTAIGNSANVTYTP